MDTSTNFFALLGLDVDAEVDPAALKAAHRKAARDCHPDAGGSDERFRAVQEAYETLKDPDRARVYRAELALREIRGRMARGYVPAGDYVPYVMSQIDPAGQHAMPAGAYGQRRDDVPSAAGAPAGTTPGHAGTAGPADDTAARTQRDDQPWWKATLSEAFEQRTRPWDGNDFDTEARGRWNAWRRACDQVEQDISRALGRRLRLLSTVPLWARALGAVAGGLLATLALLLAAGDETATMTSGWQFVGAVAGWQLARTLLVARRSYRVNDKALAAVASTAAVGGVGLAALSGGWAVVGVGIVATAAVRRWWIWYRQRGDRFMDTPTARKLGVAVDRTGAQPQVMIDDDTIAALVGQAIADWERRAAQR